MTHLSTTILSNVDPFSFPFQQDDSSFNLQEARWRSLWGSFAIVHFQAKPHEAPRSHGQESSPTRAELLDNMILDECRWTPVLMNLGLTYKNFANHEGSRIETPPSRTTVNRAIFQLARAYYEEIWQSLTLDEKLALLHLAKDRFIHIEHPGLETLLRKGLIRFDPDLRVLNASFREFVRVVSEKDALYHEEAKKGSSVWGSLKWPMGLGFGAILLFLIATQEELRTALPALIALAPLLLQGLPELSGKSKT